MLSGLQVYPGELGHRLQGTWAAQGNDGFLLTDPNGDGIATRKVIDEMTGVTYRFRWMPHREIRGDVAELERRGILNPDRDTSRLFADPRDPHRRHCFLCKDNIAECHPMEVLLPVKLAGSDYLAGANFAWIEPDHFTVMAAKHTDQQYSHHALEAMLDLHLQTSGRFRVLFNGPGAGASIPWHLHYQITTAPMPIEQLRPGCEENYPTAVCCFHLSEDGLEHAHRTAERWLTGDEDNRSLNILIASPSSGEPVIYFFPRDKRRATAQDKGLVGGFEVSGNFVLSAPGEELTFHNASVATANNILSQIHPPDWSAMAAA